EKSHDRHRRLLCARRERPHSRRAANERDELASFHSITSSARTRIVSGMVIPRAFAVLRFTTSSNLAGRSMGRSAGLVPPQNPTDVNAATAKHIGKVRSI